LVKNRRLNPPHFYLVPALGVIPFEFRQDFWRKKLKTRVPGLSYGVVCVSLRLAVWYSAGLRQTNGRTNDDSKFRAVTASCG